MVAVRPHRQFISLQAREISHQAKLLIAIAVFTVSLIFVSLVNTGGGYYGSVSLNGNFDYLNSTTIQTLNNPMMQLKTQLQMLCQDLIHSIIPNNITEAHLQLKEDLETSVLEKISVPDLSSITFSNQYQQQPRQQQPSDIKYRYCEHVLIDLGTNRGDTIAAAVDATMDVCSPYFLEADPTLKKAFRVNRTFPHFHFDANNMKLYGKGYKGFGLGTRLQKFFDTSMEDTCVYGVEGNPYFTEHLKTLEAVINGMKPKPLKHLFIHTETVVSSTDGPTTLYVDQISEKDHFWGSSLIKSMPDVRKTTQLNNGTVVEAHVEGMALSTLLRRTLAPFDPSTNIQDSADRFKDSKSGGSLLVKMDIEGAEYAVIKELAATGTLCEYVQVYNNTATLIVEYHHRLFRDDNEKSKELDGVKEAREKLKRCGVSIQQLPNFFTG